MIQANELRITNKVYDNGKICTIESINAFADGEADVYLVETGNAGMFIDPIPLTEDILLKCGFEIRKYGLSKDYYIGINEITKDWLFYIVWLNDFEYPFYMNGRHQVKYLHQLQNLYFALTQKELTIKL